MKPKWRLPAVARALAWLAVLTTAWLASRELMARIRTDEPTTTERERQLIDEERARWHGREQDYLGRIELLERELGAAGELRESREREWLGFTEMLAVFELKDLPAQPGFLTDEDGPAVDEALRREERRRAAEAERALDRGQELLLDLRALLTVEQVLGLDFLELGVVEEGATGPVVVRLLDNFGRPSGTLVSERLRLECSHAGRSVTLVFEEGYESYGGVATPFGPPTEAGSKRGGVRRIHLPWIDPAPWVAALPELFGADASDVTPDDGRWGLTDVRDRLNELLRGESRGGHWRLRSLGGVVRGVLREVHLVQLDDAGGVVRRVFADHMRIRTVEGGVRLELEDGVQERNGRTAPFLEGRYLIILPGASVRAWRATPLPGLASPLLPAGTFGSASAGEAREGG